MAGNIVPYNRDLPIDMQCRRHHWCDHEKEEDIPIAVYLYLNVWFLEIIRVRLFNSSISGHKYIIYCRDIFTKEYFILFMFYDNVSYPIIQYNEFPSSTYYNVYIRHKNSKCIQTDYISKKQIIIIPGYTKQFNYNSYFMGCDHFIVSNGNMLIDKTVFNESTNEKFDVFNPAARTKNNLELLQTHLTFAGGPDFSFMFIIVYDYLVADE
jgi:hypothetical protein